MIRDPSDGTVKEISPEANKINAVAPKTRPEEISGLRTASPKDTYQARLEWSREWLKEHQEKQRNARGSNEQSEYSTDGRTGNEAGEGQS